MLNAKGEYPNFPQTYPLFPYAWANKSEVFRSVLCCSLNSSYAHSLRRPTDNLRGDSSKKTGEDGPRKPLSRVVPTLTSDCSWVSGEVRRYYSHTGIHALACTSREEIGRLVRTVAPCAPLGHRL